MRERVRFENFELELETGDLFESGRRVKLPAQPAKLLCLLVKDAGSIVTHEQIRDAIWPDGTVVDFEQSTRFNVKRIREALGRPELVETVPRRGYRFCGVVERVRENGPSPPPVVVAAGVLVIVSGIVALFALAPNRPRAGGYSPRPLTFMPGEEKAPAISPDGSRVAFEKDGHIYLQLVNDAEAVTLTEGQRPVWSPDGTRILFLRHVPGSAEDHLYVISSLGGEARSLEVAAVVSDHMMDWSPDGTLIAFGERTSITDADVSVMLLTLETGERSRFAAGTKPVFSPDGRYLAYQDRWRGTRILIQGLNDSRPSFEYAVDQLVNDHDWTPDGTALLVATYPDGIVRVDVATGDTDIIGVGVGVMTWNLSVAATRLAYTAANENYDLWEVAGPVAPSDGLPAAGRPFQETTMVEWAPRYSPDGRHVAFASARTGRNEIWVCRTDASGCRQLTTTGARTPVWSRDGQRIAFSRGRGADSRSFVIALAGGAPKEVPIEGTSGPTAWLPDGTLLVHRLRGDTWSLWRCWVDDGGGVERVVDDAVQTRVSADGGRLFFLRSDGSVWGRDVDGSGAGTRVALPSKAFRGRWDVWNSVLVYQDRRDEEDILNFFDLARNELVERRPLGYKVALGMTISPEGARVMMPRRVLESDVWIIDELHSPE